MIVMGVLELQVGVEQVPILFDLFGAFVLFELAAIILKAYRKIASLLSIKQASLVSYGVGFILLGIGHLIHALTYLLAGLSGDLYLRLSELAASILLAYPFIFKRRETILYSSLIIEAGFAGLASIFFLYTSIIFYKVYDSNKNFDTMLISTSFLLLFLSEVLILAVGVYPLIYSGYIARLMSFILLMFLGLRLMK